jgi:small nuclear ribonucleoprotein
MNETRRPLDTLEESVGNEVTVELKGGDQHDGRLAGYDQHMNLVLETGDTGDTTVIRGDNVVSIRL